MESLIVEIEQQIQDDYLWMSSCSWGEHLLNQPVPDRCHKSFIDMATVRLILKYGFAIGTAMAFSIDQHLNEGHHKRGGDRFTSAARARCSRDTT